MIMNGKFFLQTAWTCFHWQSQNFAPATQYQLNHLSKPDSMFNVAYNIYKLDSELRKLIITELEMTYGNFISNSILFL